MTPAEYAEWARGLRYGATPGEWLWHCNTLDTEGSGPVLWLADPHPTRDDAAIIEAAPKLADAVIDLAAQVAALTAERDRLARILAVERGDASAAPEGWKRNKWDVWERPSGSVERIQAGEWDWLADMESGIAPTALEAMESADAALRGDA